MSPVGGIALSVFVGVRIPEQYGVKKYQDKDYFIINTVKPLAVILHDEEADLTYRGADKDLSTVYSLIPKEYFEQYGGLADFYYALDNHHTPRQYHVGTEKNEEYLKMFAYSVIFHNSDIFAKYQLNNFLQSNGMNPWFKVDEPVSQDWTEVADEDALDWFNWIWGYFDAGSEDIANSYDIVIVNDRVDALLRNTSSSVVLSLYSQGRKFGYLKLLVIVLTVVISLVSIKRKEYLYTCAGVLILGVLATIIIMAPCARDNYYYSIFYNHFIFFMFYIVHLFNDRKAGNQLEEY